MPNPNFTLESIKTLVRQSEQLALSLSLIHEQNLNTEEYSSLQPMTCVLLSRLTNDLEAIVTAIGVFELQGGMGEAPMQSVLKPSSC